MRVMALVDYYLPGFKGGGPAHSVHRMITRFSDRIEFFVFTHDHDLGDRAPYPGVSAGTWTPRDGARIFYADARHVTTRAIRAVMDDVRPHVVYLNSYFSPFSRVALRLHARDRFAGAAAVVAPRGEFSPGALRLKAAKKRAYLLAARLYGLHRDVTWHLTSERELTDLQATIGRTGHIFISPPRVELPCDEPAIREKRAQEASFVFVSRIAPVKNLLGALASLRAVRGRATLAIYGPIEDAAYWRQCQTAMTRLPSNVQCQYMGALPHANVFEVLSRHHFLLLPTLGENFGHIIAEALGAGCPVLLSDQTPWMDLEAREAGWIIPLDDVRRWQDVVQRCVDMTGDAFHQMSRRARGYIETAATASMRSNDEYEMFEQAIRFERSRNRH
jgi:glycosyltransferase involved in cell wall biosynthesis